MTKLLAAVFAAFLLSAWMALPSSAQFLVITDEICSGGTENGEECFTDTACVAGGGTCGDYDRTDTFQTEWMTTPKGVRGVLFTFHVLVRTGDETAAVDTQVQLHRGDTLMGYTSGCTTLNGAGGFACAIYPGSLSGLAVQGEAGPIPRVFRLNMVHSGTGTLQYYAERHWLY